MPAPPRSQDPPAGLPPGRPFCVPASKIPAAQAPASKIPAAQAPASKLPVPKRPASRARALLMAAVAAMAACLLAASPAPAGVAVIFPPDNTVEGSRIILGNVATVAPDSEADRPLADLVAEADLGEAPGPGADLILRRRQIEMRLEASGIPVSELRWLIPDEVRLTGAGTSTGPEMVRQIIADHLANSEPYLSGIWELVSVTSSTPPTLPNGRVEYRFQPQPSSNPSYLTGTILFTVDGREAGRLRATAQVDLRLPAVVAVRDLPRGHVLGEEDLSESHVAHAQAKGALTSIEAAVGQTLKTNVRTGAPIRDRDLATTAMVQKGEIVTIIAQSGGMRITATGQARQDGSLGQTISVVNQDSKKTIPAKVIGPGMVEVVF